MGRTHGRKTFISLNGVNLSQFITDSEFSRDVDSHDTTGYGVDDKTYQAGLRDQSFTMEGIYDDGVAGPRATIEPLLGLATTVPLVRRREGTGPGLPQQTVEVNVTSYVETNPVAGMITWSCDCQCSGPVTPTTQV